jgi:hypothetical protein
VRTTGLKADELKCVGQFIGSTAPMKEPCLNLTSHIGELSAAMNALTADMAVAIPWSMLHQWADSRSPSSPQR